MSFSILHIYKKPDKEQVSQPVTLSGLSFLMNDLPSEWAVLP